MLTRACDSASRYPSSRGNLTNKKIDVFDLTTRRGRSPGLRQPPRSHHSPSAAGRFHRAPKSSLTAQSEAEAGAEKAIFEVRVLPLCEPVRLGTSLHFREYPKLARLP
jgi:hypothetical protein